MIGSANCIIGGLNNRINSGLHIRIYIQRTAYQGLSYSRLHNRINSGLHIWINRGL